ncbi:hypothetical protein ACET3Z_014315 [Daucus carota]
MGFASHTYEYTSPIAASRIFKASILDSHNLIPKLLPQGIQSIKLIQGNGGAGSIKQVNFIDGRNFSSLKYHIDELSEDDYTYNYTLLEGDALVKNLEKITYEVKFESMPNGGTISKVTRKYYTIGNFKLKDEDIKAGKDKVLLMYKVIEAYLLQDPDAYV